MRNVIAVDIGGTSIKYGIVSSEGKVLFEHQGATEAEKGGEALISKVLCIISGLFNKGFDINGIAVSTAGQISPDTGVVIFATDNLPGWHGIEVKKNISDRFKIPVHIENDVNAAALGEKWAGAGKNMTDFLCLTIGTGIGGAIVINGDIYHGSRGLAGEFGHMKIVNEGYICTCGKRGCFEQYASTGALLRYVKERKAENGVEDYEINGITVFEEAYKGDEICIEAIEWFTDNLALGISNLIHIFNPSNIIIGGGISGEGESLLNAIEKKLQMWTMPSFLVNLKLSFAQCGNRAGMLGATYGLIKKSGWNRED